MVGKSYYTNWILVGKVESLMWVGRTDMALGSLDVLLNHCLPSSVSSCSTFAAHAGDHFDAISRTCWLCFSNSFVNFSRFSSNSAYFSSVSRWLVTNLSIISPRLFSILLSGLGLFLFLPFLCGVSSAVDCSTSHRTDSLLDKCTFYTNIKTITTHNNKNEYRRIN